MKLLITGCAGFIGSNLAKRAIAEEIPFVGIDNFTPNYDIMLKKRNILPILHSKISQFIEADINESKTFEMLKGKGITHIVHLAARTGVRDSSKDPEGYLQTNILGSLNVLEFARQINAKVVILASTSSAYGANKIPFKEDQQTSTPLSVYAASKIGMEALSHSFYHMHKIPITILRFFTVYGPGGRPDMSVYTFAKKISNNDPIEIYGNGKIKRDFTFVADIVDAILVSLEKPGGFNIYNIGDSNSRTLEEMISLLELNLAVKAKRKYVQVRKEDVQATLADISKAKKMLGYKPKISLEEGIKLFVEWFNSE